MSNLLSGAGIPAQGQDFNILSQPNVKCEQCGSAIFEPVFALKRISKLLAGTPNDQVVPIQLFSCTSCGSLTTDVLSNPDTLPQVLGNE